MKAFKSAAHGFAHYLACASEQFIGAEEMGEEGSIIPLSKDDLLDFMKNQIETILEYNESETDHSAVEAEASEILAFAQRAIPGAFA